MARKRNEHSGSSLNSHFHMHATAFAACSLHEKHLSKLPEDNFKETKQKTQFHDI
jgi:hypothetical protein